VVVQDTGPSSFLPEGEGVFRFKTLADAARALDSINADYEHQCRLARSLAEEQFDAEVVASSILDQALPGRSQPEPKLASLRKSG
jgi:hypothetical protein